MKKKCSDEKELSFSKGAKTSSGSIDVSDMLVAKCNNMLGNKFGEGPGRTLSLQILTRRVNDSAVNVVKKISAYIRTNGVDAALDEYLKYDAILGHNQVK